MKRFLPALFLFLFCLATNAQQRQIDSLRRVLNRNAKDTATAETLRRIAGFYTPIRVDSAMFYAKEALTMAEQNHWLVLEGKSSVTIGGICCVNGDFAKSLDYFFKALKIAEQIKDDNQVGLIYLNLGNVYSELGDEEKALLYTRHRLVLSEKMNDEYARCIALANIGDSYEKLNKLDSAKIYTTMANTVAIKLGRREIEGLSLCNLGNIYSKMNQPEIAMSYYRAAVPICKEVDDIPALSEIGLGMAALFKKSGQHDSVEYYAKWSLAITREAGFMPQVLESTTFLAAYYKERRNIDSAFAYTNLMVTVKDSLFSADKLRQTQILSVEEAIRQQQRAYELQAAEEARKTNIQYAIVGISVVTFLLIFLLLSQTIMVNDKWIRFLGILGLLLVFEFINLWLHPFLGEITHHSPILMLLIMVAIAALLIPLHHKIEHYVIHKMTKKNRRLRLAAAMKTVEELQEKEEA